VEKGAFYGKRAASGGEKRGDCEGIAYRRRDGRNGGSVANAKGRSKESTRAFAKMGG